MKLPPDLAAKCLELANADAPPIADTVSEKEFQAAVVKEAKRMGWLCYHTYDSRKSQAGFPDIVCVRDRVLWLELKTETGKLSAEQANWIDALQAAGQEAGCFRPSDWTRLMEMLA